MRFEQPKHLTATRYRTSLKRVAPVLYMGAVMLSMLALIALWRKNSTGQDVSLVQWSLAVLSGPLIIAFIAIALRLTENRPKYIELSPEGVQVAPGKWITASRIINWSLSAEESGSGHWRFSITYKRGFGRGQWSLLLDDEKVVSVLKQAAAKYLSKLPEN